MTTTYTRPDVRSRQDETLWAPTAPAWFRSEAFAEDLCETVAVVAAQSGDRPGYAGRDRGAPCRIAALPP